MNGPQDDEDQDPYQSRPKLGLDLSSLFLPIGNFLKLSAKSLETMFSLLEKQANLLLGRKIGREGSISVTIVIIISWLVMGLVVYAFAQFAILRRIRDEELEVEQAEQQEIENWRQQFLTAATATPALKTTPPTPSPKAGLNPSRSYFINSQNFSVKTIFVDFRQFSTIFDSSSREYKIRSYIRFLYSDMYCVYFSDDIYITIYKVQFLGGYYGSPKYLT